MDRSKKHIRCALASRQKGLSNDVQADCLATVDLRFQRTVQGTTVRSNGGDYPNLFRKRRRRPEPICRLFNREGPCARGSRQRRLV